MFSGRRAVVAAGPAGVAVVNLDDPVAARVERVVDLGARAQSVTADAHDAYVGLTSGDLAQVELATGVVTSRLAMGAAVDGVAMAGDRVVVLTRTALLVVGPGAEGLEVLGSTQVAGQPLPLNNARALFVGGGLAYVGHFSGYSVVDIEDPAAPRVIGTPPTGQSATHALADTGSGRLLTVTSFAGQTTLALSLFDVSDPTEVNRFLFSLDTPGTPRAVVLDRGLALVADGARGLQVVNFQPADTRGQPPAVSLETALPIREGLPTVQEGAFLRVTARASDDVLVRQVDFYLDGLPLVSDGNFPFEQRFPAPFLPPDQPTVSVQARAVDTGGNVAWSEPLLLRVLPDTTPPVVVSVSPRDGAHVGLLAAARVGFSRTLDPASLGGGAVRLIEAGADGEFGTADDQEPEVAIAFQANEALLVFSVEGFLPPGAYEIFVADTVRDLRGNPLAAPFRSRFFTAAFADADGDGLPDALEPALGLDPTKPDTNGDGVWDGDEDFNGSGRSNAAEFFAGQPMTAVAASGGRTAGSVAPNEPGRAEFHAEAGVALILRLGATGFSPRMQLFNPLGELVAQSAAVTGSARDVEVTYTTDLPGIHRVLVTSYFAGGTGTFGLSLANPSAPVDVSEDDEGGPLVNGAVHPGTIPVGDLDVWSFEAQAGDQLVLRIGTTNISPRLRLYGPEGTVVLSVTGTYSSSRAAMVSHRAAATGRYLAVVSANGLNTSGSYALRLARIPGSFEVSPGDEGGALSNGASHSGNLPSGDLDLWAITAAPGDTLVVRAGAAGLNPRLRLYDPEGAEVASAAGPYSTSRDATLTVRVTAPGPYTVVVMADNPDTSGSYTLHVARVPGAFVVSEGDEGGPLTNGAAHPGELPAGDLDLWRVDAEPGDTIALRVGAIGFNPRLRLYGPDGAELDSAEGPFTTSRDAELTIRAVRAGAYLVLLDARLLDQAGSYVLHFARVPGDPVTGTEDEGGQLTNGLGHAGNLPVGDLDVWFSEIQAGDTLVLRAGTTGFNPRLRLFDPSGAEVARVTGAFNTSRDAALDYRAPASGRYTVLVDAAPLGFGGTYQLHFARVPGEHAVGEGDDGGALTAGTAHGGTLPLGDVDLWTLVAAAGEVLELRADTTGFNPRLRLYGPDGALVASAQGSFNTSRTATLSHTVVVPGSYTLVLQAHAPEQSGTYDLGFERR